MDVEVTNGETVKVESQETLSVEYSGLPLVGFAEENHITRAPSSNFSETDGLERDYHPEKNQIICSPNYSSPTASPRIQVQELDIDYIVLGLESCDLNTVESSCGTKDINKDDLPDASKTTAIDHQDSSDSASDDCMISGDEDYTSERRQSISYGYTDTTEHCEPILSSNVSETEGIQQQKLRHPPEKLFSGRKVISPSSQAKLCKAMEQPDSPEKRITKWKGKLYFSSQNAHRILKAKGLGDIERIVEASPTAKQVIQKPNNSGQTQHRKPAIKISRQNPENRFFF
ncbi:PREDICTED: uncharacterized protein LOC104803300 [Tarenaya hassleriana]|uniref:uncharacterized protein LOC104803300 n=1 Tax=Tarenaya hassleriana TaxID=28532 RepID=UPI00053C5E47|nr:PREDICTED: uncharacterized protein LOC104803300 [Tarenaya hassleriana]